MKIIRLSETHSFKEFDCGDTDLNDFLLTSSKPFQAELLSVTYIIENDLKTIAFYSLLNDKITYQDFSNNGWKKIKLTLDGRKQFKSYPAMKIGRLGVHKDFKGQGLGSQILDYLKGLFVDNNRTGCKFITVDAYKESLSFYEKNNFIYFSDKDKDKDTRQMYYPLDRLT